MYFKKSLSPFIISEVTVIREIVGMSLLGNNWLGSLLQSQ